ncbi:TIGR01212 family radical SAM protein [bacterium]|nr:TIGR01212 family radical SAM protein [bacterium]
MALPFVPIGDRYRERFGGRVQKIPVTVAGDCPNRRGLKGMQTCIFCDEWGSAAYPEQRGQELRDQIEAKRQLLGERYAATRFLVYFQAYTSSFLSVKRLRAHFEAALEYPEVVGVVLGTRPDCVPPALLELVREFQKRTFVSIELGVQTFDEEALVFLRRGHTGQAARECIRKIKTTVDVDLGIHLIFGLPGETNESMRDVAREVAALPIDHVKLHNLHVLKGTPLADLHARGEFEPLSLEAYADRVALFLQHLPRHIAVDRLAAVSSRWDELVAPEWTRYKMKSHQFIVDRMSALGHAQGDRIF